MRKIVSSAATAVAAKSLDGRTVVVQRRDSKTRGQCRTTGRESWEKGRIECNSITSSVRYAVQVETDLTMRQCH